MYLILFIGIAILSYVVQSNLNSKFKKYSKIPIASGLSGREVAEKMLRDNGINNVTVTCTKGYLTDHYNPANGTVNLSEAVYNSRSVAAAAVAAHAVAYAPLTMRSALVPVVSFASNWVQWVLLAGIILIHSMPGILLAGVVLFALTTLFSFITLPVEIDASRRATAWLLRAGITSASEQPMAVSALKSAAYTYVVAALSSLATLAYYVMIFVGGRSRD